MGLINLWSVLAAGLLAVLYGVVQTASLMRKPAGSERMREIAAAIQEGAQAYLRRQYATIGVVGLVILVAVYFLIGKWAALGFLRPNGKDDVSGVIPDIAIARPPIGAAEDLVLQQVLARVRQR